MQNEVVAAKIEKLRIAYLNGELTSHEFVKVLGKNDSAVVSSWGPAMRR